MIRKIKNKMSTFFLLMFIVLLFSTPTVSFSKIRSHPDVPITSGLPQSDVDLLEFSLNLEFLEAEFFLWGALGHGLDKIAPNLTDGGAPPIGTRKANLSPLILDIVVQFGYQEVGHLRAIKAAVKGFPRPLLDLSRTNFAKTMDSALSRRLDPPFDPYANSLNFLLASYLIPYVGLTGYVGSSPSLRSARGRRLTAGLLAVESAQDALIRTLLYERARIQVRPYGVTVAEMTERMSEMRNRLGAAGAKDEGIVVPPVLGAEGRVGGNVIAGDEYSLGYGRTPKEILRIVYGNGSEHCPGGFFPMGAHGSLAKAYRGSAC